MGAALMILGLKKARALIESCGWVGPEREPMCATSDGSVCFEGDEAVASFSVSGALLTADCYPAGWEALEAVIAPAISAWQRFRAKSEPTPAELRQFVRLSRAATLEEPLHVWLQRPQRTTHEILRLFVRAIERSKKEAAR